MLAALCSEMCTLCKFPKTAQSRDQPMSGAIAQLQLFEVLLNGLLGEGRCC